MSKAQGAVTPERAALQFVLLLGVVSLFADMTYEGARSITGPFMASLGASAAVTGFVAGFGEFSGYGLRLVSGYLSNRTGRYWAVTLWGYALNLIAVPSWRWPGAGKLPPSSSSRSASAKRSARPPGTRCSLMQLRGSRCSHSSSSRFTPSRVPPGENPVTAGCVDTDPPVGQCNYVRSDKHFSKTVCEHHAMWVDHTETCCEPHISARRSLLVSPSPR